MRRPLHEPVVIRGVTVVPFHAYVANAARTYLRDILALTNGSVTEAAHALQLPRTYLQRLLRRHELRSRGVAGAAAARRKS